MEHSPVKVKSEKGVSGSLGTLLASYAISSESEDELEVDLKPTNVLVFPAEPVNFVPNPLANSKLASLDEFARNSNPVVVGKRCAAIFPIKSENLATGPEEQNGHLSESSVVSQSSFLPTDNLDTTVSMKQAVVELEAGTDSGPTSAVDNDEVVVDFASLKQESITTTGLELDEEDFFDGPEAYAEAREVKREVDIDSNGSSTSESEQDSETDEEEEADSEDDETDDGANKTRGKKKDKSSKNDSDIYGPRVKGELRLCDLPPIQDLHISVPHDDCKPIGTIKSVVEPLVIVEALPNTPALNLDSVLFLEEGDRALGYVFDVIGPVKQPLYCVRFNSKEHIEKNKVEIGMQVYCAPKTPYASFVFLAQLRNMKGSDASWLNDEEPPPGEEDFSDDEMERMVKKRRNRRRTKVQATEGDATYYTESTVERQLRGHKRHFNQDAPQGTPSIQNQRAPRPPFHPPMVPGFLPYQGPWQYAPSPAPNYPVQQHFPYNFRGNSAYHHRAPRGRGHQHFPAIANSQDAHPGAYNSHLRAQPPTHQRPWLPPNQWQNTLRGGFNFGVPQYVRPQPPPPPPPPPPPGV